MPASVTVHGSGPPHSRVLAGKPQTTGLLAGEARSPLSLPDSSPSGGGVAAKCLESWAWCVCRSEHRAHLSPLGTPAQGAAASTDHPPRVSPTSQELRPRTALCERAAAAGAEAPHARGPLPLGGGLQGPGTHGHRAAAGAAGISRCRPGPPSELFPSAPARRTPLHPRGQVQAESTYVTLGAMAGRSGAAADFRWSAEPSRWALHGVWEGKAAPEDRAEACEPGWQLRPPRLRVPPVQQSPAGQEGCGREVSGR